MKKKETIKRLKNWLHEEKRRNDALLMINNELGKSSRSFRIAVCAMAEQIEKLERENQKLRDRLQWGPFYKKQRELEPGSPSGNGL